MNVKVCVFVFMQVSELLSKGKLSGEYEIDRERRRE